ncbi:MAG: acetyl-CoA carboxylase biotin carboxyl carrier protein subunit [Paracoccaceae bacterium]|nr:acetyl-CoA carboxylase biotin carboxyl carrier protein subunit [Paracoccaceae bacterium]
MAKKNHEADVNFIKELAVLLKEHDLTELEVARDYGENDNLNVRVARQVLPNHEIIKNSSRPDIIEVQTPEVSESKKTTDINPLAGAIPSPMVGTAYLAPEPGANNFINVGQDVKEGDTLLIIEAMKTMNQITSPKSGKIKRILVEDGTAVEFGTPLMTIE